MLCEIAGSSQVILAWNLAKDGVLNMESPGRKLSITPPDSDGARAVAVFTNFAEAAAVARQLPTWQAQTQETQVLIGKLVPATDIPRIARTAVEGLRAAAPDLPGALLHAILGPLPNAAAAQRGRSQLLSAWLETQTAPATSAAGTPPPRANAAVPLSDEDRRHKREKALAELDRLVGLDPVKDEVRRLLAYDDTEARRITAGQPKSPPSRHPIFSRETRTRQNRLPHIIAPIYAGRWVAR